MLAVVVGGGSGGDDDDDDDDDDVDDDDWAGSLQPGGLPARTTLWYSWADESKSGYKHTALSPKPPAKGVPGWSTF